MATSTSARLGVSSCAAFRDAALGRPFSRIPAQQPMQLPRARPTLASRTLRPLLMPFSSSSSPSSPSPRPAQRAVQVPAHPRPQRRGMHTTPPAPRPAAAPTAPLGRSRRQTMGHNREPVPEQPPPTDFGEMDMLGSTPAPATAVQVCHEDGFTLGSGVRVAGGDGALLVGGEAFAWRPWEAAGKGKRLLNGKGQWEVGEEAFAVLGMLWPRPDLLILGLGPEIRPLSPATRRAISDLGMRVEVLDTRNAASQYNMLATERGVDDVAAALIPIGWKEGPE